MAYHMIGGDGGMYGPFSAEELRSFVKDGRADARTQIRTGDTDSWSALGDWPEFAGLFAKPPSPPPMAPGGAPPPLPRHPSENIRLIQTELPAPEYVLDIGGCIGRAWRLLMSDFWHILGVYVLFLLVMGAINSIPCLNYLTWMLNSVLLGGFWIFMLKKVRGQPATLDDLFAGFRQPLFVPLLVAGLVSGILILIGLLCCVLPGVYLAVAWMLAMPLIADRKLDFWPAMETSRKTITRHWWRWLGFSIVLSLLVVAGFLAFCLGVLVAAPLVMLAKAHAYNDLFGPQTQKNP